ncbi:hypothetical protein QCA50_013840 [Cerrena zonata]|uniref:Uncharacterized protein n=1 Tax=Cerrena zonata TaxID=2478898 RepID=A0AAW0FSU0_9APHY
MPPPASLSPTPTQPLISFASIFNDPTNKPHTNFVNSSLGLFLIMLFIIITVFFLSGIILLRVCFARTARVNEIESESGAGYSVSAEKAIMRALSAGGSSSDVRKIGIVKDERKNGGLRKLILPGLVKPSRTEKEKTSTRTWSFLSFLSPKPRLSASLSSSNPTTSGSHSVTENGTHNDFNEISVPEIKYEQPTPTISTPTLPSTPPPLAFNLLYVPGSRAPIMRLPSTTTIIIPSDDDTYRPSPSSVQQLPSIFRSTTTTTATSNLPLAVISNQTGQPFELSVAPMKNPRSSMRKQGHMRTPSQHGKENFPGLSVAASGVEGRRRNSKQVTFADVPSTM